MFQTSGSDYKTNQNRHLTFMAETNVDMMINLYVAQDDASNNLKSVPREFQATVTAPSKVIQ